MEALAHGPSAVELMARLGRSTAGAAGPAAWWSTAATRPRWPTGWRAIPGARVVLDPAEQAAVWAVRRGGHRQRPARRPGRAGRPAAAARSSRTRPCRPSGCPSCARGIRRILDREGLDAVWYGHASVGCLHIRPRMDLRAAGARRRAAAHRRGDRRPRVLARRVAVGRARRRPGAQRAAAADVPARHDRGLRRAEAAARSRADPQPRRADRAGPPRRGPAAGGLAAAARPEHGDELRGRGRASRAPARPATATAPAAPRAGAMCPSYQALGDERHSTRGRAAILRGGARGPAAGRPGRRRAARGARAVPGLQGLRRRSAPPGSTWRG